MAEILVYRLIDPAVIVRREDALRAHVSAGLGDRGTEPSFYLSPVSGCFKAFDRTTGRAHGRVPDNDADVAQTVAQYIVGVNRAAAKYRSARHLSPADYPDPFPSSGLRHMSSMPIYATSREKPDRWRSLWMWFLPAEAMPASETAVMKTVPVHGGTVDVMVGKGGRILSVVSTVRPWIGVQRMSAYEAAEHDHSDDANSGFFYVLDGAEEPQTFLAPYTIDLQTVEEHPHGTALRPACMYALIVDMTLLLDGEGGRVVSLVMDGTGEMAPADARRFQIDWRYGRLDEWLSGEVVVAHGPEVRVQRPGMYHIELMVTHLATGAIRSTWRQIPINPMAAERIA